MKDFKQGKKIQTGHGFPSGFGFSGSTGQVTNVSPYTRSNPLKLAKGGFVNTNPDGNAATQRDQPPNQLDVETGGKTPLRPGFSKGGRMKKALGGPVRAARGGALSQVGKTAKSAVEKKVAAAKPKGAAGRKNYGGFNSKPLIGR